VRAIQPYRQAVFDAARIGDDREPPGAYDADALVAMADDSLRRASTATPGTKVRAPGAVLTINLDFPSFAAGTIVPGSYCEIPRSGRTGALGRTRSNDQPHRSPRCRGQSPRHPQPIRHLQVADRARRHVPHLRGTQL